MQNCRQCIENLEKEKTSDKKLISAIEDENLRYKKETDQLHRDKDSLITQLMRKNDDIAELQDKIKVLECSLQSGEIHTIRGLKT